MAATFQREVIFNSLVLQRNGIFQKAKEIETITSLNASRKPPFLPHLFLRCH